jgi:hypothetical protein
MKVAAILALSFALALGVWAINDYRHNEEMRRDFARQGLHISLFELMQEKPSGWTCGKFQPTTNTTMRWRVRFPSLA